jgi:MshEN domain
MAKGLVSPEGLRSGLDACRRHGGRLGTWLVRLGLITEAALLDALTEQTGCPPASGFQLATAPAEVRNTIPQAFAKRSLVVAFARHGRTLEVAMVKPNDLLLVDEIAKVTGLVPRPHVATEAALSAALALPGASRHPVAAAPPPGPPPGRVREWRRFWTLESTPPELMRALEAPPLRAPRTTAVSFPTLAPVAVAAPAPSKEAEGLTQALSCATHRDQVAAVVLAHAAHMAYRVALFSLYQKKVMGWAVRGPSVVEDDFHTLILPLDRPSIFLNLTRGVYLHVGPLGPGEGNQLLVEALGPPPPHEAVVAPVRVRGKPAGFLWLDEGERPVGDVPIAAVQEVARLAGLALEILVLRQKVKTGARLTEGAPPD